MQPHGVVGDADGPRELVNGHLPAAQQREDLPSCRAVGFG